MSSKFSVGQLVLFKQAIPPEQDWISVWWALTNVWHKKAIGLAGLPGEVHLIDTAHPGIYRIVDTVNKQLMSYADESWLEPALQNVQYGSISFNINPVKTTVHSLQWPTDHPLIKKLDEVVQPEPREYDGFCNPCGGFRKHRIGCPVKK